ncbi:uncharacterized protein LOC117173048 isoform X2 [Belonocnema kinseyi]|nr:uncharacterized protein LOC117173048 isoform X2 [Belonocnema kinseyi]XP_033217328.1 uncharacterized protein LOC117173048 isoform X2 [Belonocnema kinseyi]
MMSISCLNEECLTEIFEYCDIFQTAKVCKLWREVALRSWRTFKLYDSSSVWSIDEYGTLYIDSDILQPQLIRSGRYLKALILDEPKSNCIDPGTRVQIPELNEKSLAMILPHTPNLRYVKAYLRYNAIYGIQFLTNYCEDITELILNCEGYWQFKAEKRFQHALGQLFKSKRKLKRLNYKGSISGESLEYLPADMEDIHIRSYSMGCESVVKGISKFHKLRNLELDGNYNITGLFMALQACSKSLKVLILRGCGSVDIKREEIPILSSLEILELRQNSWLEDDFLLKAGEHFKRLKSLTIEDDKDSFNSFNKGICGMCQLPLEELNLILCNEISPAVSKLHTLRSLSLESTFVDLEILCEVIKNCPKLKELHIVNYTKKEWNYEVLEAAALTAKNRAPNSILKIWIDGKFWKAVKKSIT